MPLIVNLIRGDIGIVGPRPCPPHLHHLISSREQRWEERCAVRPGIVSWAVLNFPQTWREELRHDLFYLENRGFKFDWGVLRKSLVWSFDRFSSSFTKPE